MFDLDAIEAEDRTGWSGEARSARVVELAAHIRRAEAELLRCIGEWDADLAWAADGSKSPACWLTRHAAMTINEAREAVRTARLVQENTATAKALAAGDVTPAHVKITARAARHFEDIYAAHEDVLLDAMRGSAPDDYRDIAAHWRGIAEDVTGREPSERRFDRRHLHISDVLDGMTRIDGYVDGETGVRLRRVLDELEPPDADDGPIPPRSLAQRRADALARLAGGEPAPRTTVHAVVDLDTLQGRMPTDLRDARCDLLGAGPVDVATILRMTCDCSISRVLMQGTSTVLDLGRATPVVSAAQRRALWIRDGGCTEPGCNVPPERCDAHHVQHWAEGGPTDLSNQTLKCRRHHLHAHGGRRAPPPRDADGARAA
jgi:hypothetical protein